MADNKKESIKYKFGESELDLKTYITNLDHNVQKYMDSKDWNQGQREEFMNSYNQYLSGLKEQLETNNNRFSSDSFGVISDSMGLLSDDTDGDIKDSDQDYYYNESGERITTDDYNKLKDKKKKNWGTFKSRGEVAQYFNTIAKALRDRPQSKEKEKEKEKFDIKKHGFVADWTRKNSASGEAIDILPYLNLDPVDQTTGKRARTNRIKYLQGQISDYLQSLEGLEDKYNFEGTSFKDLNEYKAKLQSLSDKLVDGWSEDDMIAANQAGIGASFYNGFLSEDENPNISKEELEKQKGEALKKQNQEEFSQYMQGLLDTYNSNKGQWNSDNAYDLGKLEYWDSVNGFNGDAFRESFSEEELADENTFAGRLKKLVKNTGNIASWIFNPIGRASWGYLLGEFSEKPFEIDMDQYINEYLKNPYSKEGKRALSAIIGAGKYETISEGPYSGMFYIPQTTDTQTQKGLVYDPNSGKLMNVFIGDIPSQFNKIRDKWKEGKGLIKTTDKYSLYKEGGNIHSMQIGGGFSFNDFMKEDREANIRSRAETNNRTYDQQEASERRVGILGNVKNTAQNPSEGFTNTDMLRLGTIAADIISMGSAFIPGAGSVVSAATGAVSSLGTFFADAFEDGLDSKDFGNLATNLGMDVLGLIPGGGAASKGAKIAKTLAKYTSRIMATIGAMNTISNAPQIINSFKKLESPSELTVDDWRNISAGLGLVTGGVAAGTRKYKQAKMKAANAKPNNVAVELIDKNNTKKTVLFDGDDATAIRNAKGDAKTIKSITSKYNDYKDWDVSTNSSFGWRGLKGSDGSKQIPIGSKKGKAKVFDVSEGYDIFGNKTGKTYALRGKWEADDVLTDVNKAGTKTSSENDYSNQMFSNLQRTSKRFNKKIATRKEQIARHDALEQKGKDAYTKKTPGLTAEEAKEYNQLRRGKAKRGTARIDALRKWIESHENPNFKTKELLDFESKYVKDGNYEIPIPNSNEIVRGVWADIVKKYGLRKKGGTLDMIKVRSFKNSGSITNTSADGVNWYEDMFKHKSMKDWLNKYDVNNYEDFNNLQKSWAANKQATGYSINNPRASYNQGVFDRQGKWNETGTNVAIEEAFNKGRIRRPINAISGDNASKGYQDGYFGVQEFLRHGGTEDSWKGHENELKNFQEELQKKGLTYTLDKDSGMYLLGKYNSPQTTTITNTDSTTTDNPVSKQNAAYTNPFTNQNNRTGINPNAMKHLKFNFNPQLKGFFKDPTLTYGLGRLLYGNTVNDILTKMAIEAEKPFLQNPFQYHRTITSDLNSEIGGQWSAGQLYNLSSKHRTSDGNSQNAMLLDSALKGLDFINQGKKASDEVGRISTEQAWQQEKENAKNVHDTSTQNSLAQHQTAYNISKHKQASESQKFKNMSTFSQQLEHEAKVKKAEEDAKRKSIEDQVIKNDIQNYVAQNLEKSGLDPEAAKLYQQIHFGTLSPSDIYNDSTKWNNYVKARAYAEQLEGDAWRKYYNIAPNEWSGYGPLSFYNSKNNSKPSFNFEYVEGGKNGTKLKIANIKARTADANRFQKQIQESLNRHEKVLDRISKSLYGYIKASIVK